MVIDKELLEKYESLENDGWGIIDIATGYVTPTEKVHKILDELYKKKIEENIELNSKEQD